MNITISPELIQTRNATHPVFQPGGAYERWIAFGTRSEAAAVPNWLFWTACLTVLVVLNLHPDHISAFISLAAAAAFGQPWGANRVRIITHELFIPAKGLLFVAAGAIVSAPVIQSVWRSGPFWRQLPLAAVARMSVLVLGAVFILVFPYAYPHGVHSDVFGLSGLGVAYGEMSKDPFSETNVWVYRRLLQPAIAHYLQLDGRVLYYAHSLLCTGLLVFLSIAFCESKVRPAATGALQPLSYRLRLLFYLSAATSSYVMMGLLLVGYPDSLAFVLVLIMGCIPMTPQARLGTIVLALAAHEGIAFALVPIILFCFPKRELRGGLLLIVLYYGVLATIIATGVYADGGEFAIVSKHLSVEDKGNLAIVTDNPSLALIGVFFAYKALWAVILYVVWLLRARGEAWAAAAVTSVALFPGVMIFIALDTTRLVGFGFLGMLMAIGILMSDYQNWSPSQRRWITALVAVNILIPSHTVILVYSDLLNSFPYRGAYHFIDAILR